MINEIYAVEIDGESGIRKMWTNKACTEIHCATSLTSAYQMIVFNSQVIGKLNPKVVKYGISKDDNK